VREDNPTGPPADLRDTSREAFRAPFSDRDWSRRSRRGALIALQAAAEARSAPKPGWEPPHRPWTGPGRRRCRARQRVCGAQRSCAATRRRRAADRGAGDVSRVDIRAAHVCTPGSDRLLARHRRRVVLTAAASSFSPVADDLACARVPPAGRRSHGREYTIPSLTSVTSPQIPVQPLMAQRALHRPAVQARASSPPLRPSAFCLLQGTRRVARTGRVRSGAAGVEEVARGRLPAAL
jgi:hypothetical protein